MECLAERRTGLRIGAYMRVLPAFEEEETRYASISASSSSEATGVRGLQNRASDERESEENVNGGVSGGEDGGGDEGGRSSGNAYANEQVRQVGCGFASCLRVCLTVMNI